MRTEIKIRRSHCYVNSFENTFVYVPIVTLFSEITFTHLENIFHIWNEMSSNQETKWLDNSLDSYISFGATYPTINVVYREECFAASWIP